MAYKVNLEYNSGRGNFLHSTLEQTDFMERITEETRGQKVVNLGSGNLRPVPHAINVDFIDGDQVDIVSTAYELEFEDNSIDFVLCLGLLEHLKYPAKVIEEIQRILKPGGKVYCTVPFLQPLHPSPEDYWRTTVSGLETWFEDFDKIESGFNSGPSSTLSWIWYEYEKYLGMNLDASVSPFLPLFKGAIKYVDDYLLHLEKLDFKKAETLACSIFFYGSKKQNGNAAIDATSKDKRNQAYYRTQKNASFLRSYTNVKSNIKNWAETLNLDNTAIYGTGDLCELMISAIDNPAPTFIIDRDRTKWGSTYHGVTVISPDDIEKQGIKHILIASFSHKDVIKEELTQRLKGKPVQIITPDF